MPRHGFFSAAGLFGYCNIMEIREPSLRSPCTQGTFEANRQPPLRGRPRPICQHFFPTFGWIWPSFTRLETVIGGVKSPKIRGRANILNFQGPLKLTPFYRDAIENRQFWGSKVQVFEGQLSGRVPPPSSVRCVLTPPPPIPVSDKD